MEVAKYHLLDQEANALLRPIHSSLNVLEQRTQHYLDRLTMTPEDEEAVRMAQQILASARMEIERLWLEGAKK